jgi:hypothetical protein
MGRPCEPTILRLELGLERQGIGKHTVHWRFELKIRLAFRLAMVTCPVAFEAFKDILSFFPLGEPFIPLHRHDHD